MKNKTIKAIVFDLGNVLIKFDPALLTRGFSEYGKVDEKKMTEYLLESDNINRYMAGKITSSQFYTRTKKIFRIKISYREFYEVWNSVFHPYPEMEDMVRAIREKYPEIKLVLLSNTNEEHYEFLEKEYGILEVFDECVVSHEVRRIKPHPDIFQEALRLAGSLPRETFYTDDRKDLIEAARVMGLRAYQFVGHEELRKHLAKFGIEV